jgi:hypothetical protein
MIRPCAAGGGVSAAAKVDHLADEGQRAAERGTTGTAWRTFGTVTPTFDWCRHCGQREQMTEEHLPPKSTGNNSPINLYTEQNGALIVLRSFQEGHTIPSLCNKCNNKASQRGLPQAYELWRKDVIGHLMQAAAVFHHASGRPPDDLWLLTQPDGAFNLPMEHGTELDSDRIVNLHPGRIVRHALGMILAVQGSRYLLDNHSQLAIAYHSDEPTTIEPFTLHVALANAGPVYFKDVLLSASIDLTGSDKSSSTPCWLLCFPPFLIALTEGLQPPIEATRIDQWFTYPTSQFFNKRDRRVSYPIADQRTFPVRILYQDRGRLPQM